MELYLFDRVGYERLYNCSAYNVTDIPIEKRQDVIWGLIFVVMFVLYELLYIPCLISIGKHMAGQACYKFMFFIGLIDIVCLPICALLHGYFAITGAVFCSHPDLIYVSGAFGFFFWVIESSGDIILAVNRCVEMISPVWGERLYSGNKAWLWLLPVMLYGLYAFYYTMPILFSGIYFAWFFNPHVGYIDDFGTVYNSPLQNFHNWFVTFGLSVSYLVFTGFFFFRVSRGNSRATFAQKMSFLQVLAISLVNIGAGLIYIYMQHFQISSFIIYVASNFWVTAHGLPCLIYLFMNKTIRNDFFGIFGYVRANSAQAGPAFVTTKGAAGAINVSAVKVTPVQQQQQISMAFTMH